MEICEYSYIYTYIYKFIYMYIYSYIQDWFVNVLGQEVHTVKTDRFVDHMLRTAQKRLISRDYKSHKVNIDICMQYVRMYVYTYMFICIYVYINIHYKMYLYVYVYIQGDCQK
jgi:hypothetical protein